MKLVLSYFVRDHFLAIERQHSLSSFSLLQLDKYSTCATPLCMPLATSPVLRYVLSTMKHAR